MSNEATKEDQEKINANVWEDNFDEAVSVINRLTDQDRFDEKGGWKPNANKWTWFNNDRCKYISLRIDMRNRGFVILDRNGERISLDQLKWQHGDKK